MLSLYAKLDTENISSDNPRDMTGIKSTLEGVTDIPRTVIDAVLGELKRNPVRGDGVAVFATEEALDIIPISTNLPIMDPQTGRGKARWGQPYIAPLLAMESTRRPHCVVFMDRNRFRCFVVKGTDIEEVRTRVRVPAPEESEALTASKQIHPAYVATRGGAAVDKAHEHLDVLVERFYREVASELTDILDAKHHASVIVCGPEREMARLERVWPGPLVEEIAATLSSLPDPDCSPTDVLEHVSDAIDKLERGHQKRLYERVRNVGVTGLTECLSAIQQGKVHTVFVPWPVDGTVYREVQSGYVATTSEQAQSLIPEGGQVETVALDDALVKLASEFSVKLEFATGEYRQMLLDECSGIGALLRW